PPALIKAKVRDEDGHHRIVIDMKGVIELDCTCKRKHCPHVSAAFFEALRSSGQRPELFYQQAALAYEQQKMLRKRHLERKKRIEQQKHRQKRLDQLTPTER